MSNTINKIALPRDVTEVINTYIQDFEASEYRKRMTWGEDYYRSKNTNIMKRRMLIYAEDDDGNPYETDDPYKANNKIPSGYLKLLIDQKVNYLLGKGVAYESANPEELEEVLGRKFPVLLMQVAKEASKKVVGWMHPYINDKGEFKLSVIPSEQVIPVYTVHDREELEMVIRYYSVKALNKDGESVSVVRVEIWDNEQVTYYQEDTQAKVFNLLGQDDMLNIFGRRYPNPKYHFSKNMKHGNTVTKTEGLSWGNVPFIALYNNDEEESDLTPVKAHIDAYDIVTSDFANNLEDFQDIYWILKGYDGQNLGDFLYNVKRYKTLKTSDDGDARAETIEIPHEARKEAREALERDIFGFGQGVNPNESGDGNLTNVVIKARFASLDLKANQFELEVKDFIYKLIDFVNKYREIKNDAPIDLEDVTFNRALIMNEVELLQTNREQKGAVSEDTRLSNHPWVEDVDEEKKLMEAEKPTVDLDMFGGDDDEEPPTED